MTNELARTTNGLIDVSEKEELSPEELALFLGQSAADAEKASQEEPTSRMPSYTIKDFTPGEYVIVHVRKIRAYWDEAFKRSNDDSKKPVCKSWDGINGEPGQDFAGEMETTECRKCKHKEWGPDREKPKCNQKRELFVKARGKRATVRIYVPPTSISNWVKYLNGVLFKDDIGYYGCITEIGKEPHPDYECDQFTFKFQGKVDSQEAVKVIKARGYVSNMIKQGDLNDMVEMEIDGNLISSNKASQEDDEDVPF